MNEKHKESAPSQEHILKAIKEIETAFHEQLHDNVRYERYMDGESNEEWVELLGSDVLFATHPYATLAIVNRIIEQENISNTDAVKLRTAALIHDWGELKIDGKGIGDISYSHKTSEHEEVEHDIFKQVTAHIPTDIQRHFLGIYAGIIHNRESMLGKIFNAAERIGYLKTALRAYNGVDGQRIKNWRGLVGNVFSYQIEPLIAFAENYPSVKLFLHTNKELIDEILNENWDEAPNDKDGLLTFVPKKLRTVKDVWTTYIEKA
jgi:5'-deoxynucleotidase YfbR-like HD superfamily hydrolase